MLSYPKFEGNSGKGQDLYIKILEKGVELTLFLEIHLPCIEETQDKSGTGVADEAVHCFLDVFILIDYIADILGPTVTLWRWHP